MKHLEEALKMYGVTEVPGANDNPKVIALFDELGFDGSKLKDETSWCAAFANAILKRADMPYQNTLNARSFLKIGKQVFTPQLGDVVVLWRESRKSWKGHVGFFIRETENYIYILGGNQNNRVKISAYPKYRLLQYRRISKKK
jgi:uncharacterized protein (TIGR02594 family)